MRHHDIVILTGAGISAESGVPTFRSDDGLWLGHRVEDVATPEAFARDPARVQAFYNQRRRQMAEVQPNAAHRAIADFAARFQGRLTLITQNVDDLHDRAHADAPPAPGFQLIHMHGELLKAQCTATGRVLDWTEDLDAFHDSPFSPDGWLRPHIIWFSEFPLHIDRIERALATCDLFVSIGTSGEVYPAAGFVRRALMAGARTVEINLEPSLGASLFDEGLYGPATETVPAFLDTLT
jgi:NAD-dependent deacetylase